ncbi:hypothetical protein V3H18_00080 [Methylocystis sp. 9N]|uniref:DUF4239 domain-containing protein n=1 Tax=Methylocystis borbori TaxID=3118750 RepID=A0ABU7XCJ1_9HYPH
MNSITLAVLTLFLTLLAGLAGFCITSYLKESWLDGISRDQFKALRNMIGSLLAVCLGFLLITAKNNYDKKVDELRLEASKVILLHRVLDIFGGEADQARTKIIRTLQGQIDLLRVATNSYIDQKEAFKKAKIDSFRQAVLSLKGNNEQKSWAKSTALSLTQEIAGIRWKIYNDLNANIPMAVVIFLIALLVTVFFNFGVISHRHWTAALGLVSASMCVSGAIFLLVELDRPFQGFFAVPTDPLKSAVDIISTDR